MTSFKLALLATCSLAISVPALAQSGDRVLREDTIIVTSPGPDRLSGELISKTDALNRDDLIADMKGTLGDTLVNRPGVSTTYFGAGASRPVLRGLGAERVLVLTNGMGVIDASAASPDHQAGADGLDAERVEILRGPAALAYGGQAIGGVVNVIDGLIVDQLPEENVFGQAYGAYNSVNEGTEIGGKAGFVLGDFVFNFSAAQRDFDDYDIPGFAESSILRAMEGEEGHDHEDEDHDDEDHDDHDHDDHDHEDEEVRDTLSNSFLESETLSAGLSWVGERAYLGVSVRQQTSEYGLPGHHHHHEEEGEHDDEDHADEDHDDHDHEDEDHDDHDHDHEEEGAFIDLEHIRVDVQGGYRFNGDVLDELKFNVMASDYEHAEYEGPGEIGTQYFSDGVEGRVELDHHLGDSSGTIGVQFTDKTFAADGEEAFITDTDTTSFGLFVFETREWDSGFGVEGGFRGETVELDNERFGKRDFDLLSVSLGAHRHWENGLFLGAQFSLTNRAPNESELFADGAHLATEQYEVGNPDFDSERGINYEVTARYNRGGFNIGANLFYTDFGNFIYLTPGEAVHDGGLTDEIDELPVFLFTQEDAHFSGGEVYASYDLSAGPLGADWTVDASVDFVTAELDDGGNLPYIPPLTLKTDVSADWGLFDAGIGVTVADEQNDTGVGILPTDGYTTLDLSAGLDLAEWAPSLDGARLFVQARNVTDEEVRYATSVLKDTVPAPGRNIRVGLSAKF